MEHCPHTPEFCIYGPVKAPGYPCLQSRCSRIQLALDSCRVNLADQPGGTRACEERTSQWESLLRFGVRPAVCTYLGSVEACACVCENGWGFVCPYCLCEHCAVRRFDTVFRDWGPAEYAECATRAEVLHRTRLEDRKLWRNDQLNDSDCVRELIARYGDHTYDRLPGSSPLSPNAQAQGAIGSEQDSDEDPHAPAAGEGSAEYNGTADPCASRLAFGMYRPGGYSAEEDDFSFFNGR